MTRIICFMTLLLTAAVAAHAQSGFWSDTAPGESGVFSTTDNATLPDGRVIFAGVFGHAVLYDPDTGTWRPTTSSPAQGWYVILQQQVLFAWFSSYILYYPDSDQWSPRRSMLANHGQLLLVSLRDGRALVIGEGTAEVYSPRH